MRGGGVGFQVVEAADGDEALEILRSNDEGIDGPSLFQKRFRLELSAESWCMIFASVKFSGKKAMSCFMCTKKFYTFPHVPDLLHCPSLPNGLQIHAAHLRGPYFA